MIEVVIAFVRQYWRPIAYITFLSLIFGFGYYKGYSHEKARYDAHLQTDATLMAVAKAENERRVKEQEIITANVTKEYSDAVNKLNDYYKSHPRIIRLCTGPSKTDGMPTTSKGTSGTTPTVDRSTETSTTEIDLLKLGKEIAQCQALIAWEKRQEEVQ